LKHFHPFFVKNIFRKSGAGSRIVDVRIKIVWLVPLGSTWYMLGYLFGHWDCFSSHRALPLSPSTAMTSSMSMVYGRVGSIVTPKGCGLDNRERVFGISGAGNMLAPGYNVVPARFNVVPGSVLNEGVVLWPPCAKLVRLELHASGVEARHEGHD
jgi:hypothetical protein